MKKQKNNQRLTLAIAFALGCCIFSTSNAFAEEASTKAELAFDLEGITVEAARPDWELKLSPGSVTVIRPDDYKGEQKTLPDLMRKVPGVHVREVNGKGQYTTVTVRGSTAAQVGVFIDGVLSNLGGDAAADLSTIPIANVERIEVYRGYIPARFAGTFMGGVINIVTKRPDKADVSVELGKSSYGGKKGAVEVTAPLGDGSLMFGTNYESSDGDFSYENYAAVGAVKQLETAINESERKLTEFYKTSIENYAGSLNYNKAEFLEDTSKWEEYIAGGNDSQFATDYKNTITEVTTEDILNSGVKDWYAQNGNTNISNNDIKKAFINSLTDDDAMPSGAKDKLLNYIVKDKVEAVNPETSDVTKGHKQSIEDNKKKIASAKNAKRWRKYNDYENINSILKWQNDEWMVKAAWNKIDRHLPDSLWNGAPSDAPNAYTVDVYDTYFYDSRRQEVDTKELLLQNRNNVGKLEWGWMVDYTKSDKSYRAEHIMDNDITAQEKDAIPLREWSRYESDKYNGQIDGSYKISDKNMLDFQINYSNEELKVDGSLMDKALGDSDMTSTLGQIRNRYEQEMINVQLQDTITLDNKSSWFLTPSVKYNRSTITGHSDGKRFEELSDKTFSWINPKDEQTDDKFTWQLALKKEFDDNFTMRMTGGTYYRLLNMYEIAGDGAGILPAPNNSGRESSFPIPEEGKQFDISALWHGTTLGAYNKTSLTYFWRDSENMLQLQRFGKDYWSYVNDNKGTARGIELQSNFNWNKFDLDIQATYTKTKSQRRDSSSIGHDYVDVWATYQPEWEGNVRLTYRPVDTLDIFAEAHYTDMYYTSPDKVGTGGESAYMAGRPVDDLLVFNAGMKLKLKNKWQVVFGCNDILNKGPEQKIYNGAPFENGYSGYINTEFPLQGRTYYATVKCDF